MARPKTALAAWIREQRGIAGWKSEELARRVGVSESTVRGWESGRAVGWDKLEAMERLFGQPAPGRESGSAPEMGALLSKMDRQTDAIETAARAIQTLAQALGPVLAVVDRQEVRIRALEAQLGLLPDEPEVEASPEQGAPHDATAPPGLGRSEPE